MLFSDGAGFITLSYLFSALLIFGLIGQTIFRARATKKQIEELSRQFDSLQKSKQEELP